MMKGERTKTLVKSHCWKVLKVEDLRRLYGIKYLIANRLYALSLGVYSSFYTELYVVAMILEVVVSKSWSLIWLERDSLGIVVCFQCSNYRNPNDLYVRWLNYPRHFRLVSFKCSHIYREANIGSASCNHTRWDSPLVIYKGFHEDYSG